MESWAEMRPSALAFSTSFFVMADRTQLVEEEVFFLNIGRRGLGHGILGG
jgi:hypothetical protein